VRHAPAGTPAEFAATGQEDRLRPLTADGRRKMARAALGLRSLVPRVAVLWTSPLVRAHQTAAIVGEAWGVDATVLPALAPGGTPEAILAVLRGARGLGSEEPRVLVGHEPSLSELVGWLLTAERRSAIELKKGAACLLGFSGRPAAGAASLRWLLQPRHLRALA
jgi:phosphohistidine phosphatase